MKNIIVFDNNGESFDRYTIIDKNTGEMCGASDSPFHPQGFGQYCGNVAWDYFAKTVGANYMHRIETEDPKHYARIMKYKTKEIIQEFKNEGNIGKVVEMVALPEDVVKFINQRFN